MSSKVSLAIVKGFQRLMLGGLSMFMATTKLLDLDRDGDVDSDDAKMLFNAATDFMADCKEDAAKWNSLSPGARLDWLCDHMAEHYPKVPRAVWINLNSVLHLSATVLTAAGVTFSLRQLKV